MADQAYYERWLKLNDRMKQAGFTWGSMPEKGEEHQYLLADLYKMPRRQFEQIQQATEDIARVFQKTSRFLQQSPALYPQLLMPENTWDAVQLPTGLFSYLTRFDLIVKEDDIRVIEANCDTPTGFVEASVANRVACEQAGVESPNRLEERVREAFQQMGELHGIGREETVFFTSYAWHVEDRQTTEFFRAHSGFAKTRYVGLDELRVREEGVFAADGERIQYLYRLYPLEYFSRDKGPQGEPIGDWFLDHVVNGRIKLMNPPSAFLCQVKTVLAVIWALHEAEHPLFDGEEHAIIARHFLPTYLDAEPLAGVAHVQKPVWGREGGGVSLVDAAGQVFCEDRTDYYYTQDKIYQQYTPMPVVTVDTWAGPDQGSLLVGSFWVGGKASGVFLRVGGKITGNLSLFWPVTVVEE